MEARKTTVPQLRPAAAADAVAIAAVWHRGWSDGHLGHVPEALHEHRRLEDFRARVPGRLRDTLVATVDARVVGFVTVRGDEVEQVYVAAEARGGGVADALLRQAEQGIAARFEAAWLAVAAGNARARRFYERNGWRDAGALDYEAEISGGTLVVPCRRYQKRVALSAPSGSWVASWSAPSSSLSPGDQDPGADEGDDLPAEEQPEVGWCCGWTHHLTENTRSSRSARVSAAQGTLLAPERICTRTACSEPAGRG
jgi:ribosomal protein S18 acetylase RimI-like enzyme